MSCSRSRLLDRGPQVLVTVARGDHCRAERRAAGVPGVTDGRRAVTRVAGGSLRVATGVEAKGSGTVVRRRTWELVRYQDLGGVSGTGVVAEGCVCTDGSVAWRWRGSNPATAVWPDLESVLAVHGDQGATEVRWLEFEPRRSTGDDLDHLFGVQHAVLPPSSLADPAGQPGNHSRGWAGGRHLR